MSILRADTKKLDLSPRAKRWLSNVADHLGRALANRDGRYVSMRGGYRGRVKISLSPALKKSFANFKPDEQKKIKDMMGTEIKVDIMVHIRPDDEPIILLG